MVKIRLTFTCELAETNLYMPLGNEETIWCYYLRVYVLLLGLLTSFLLSCDRGVRHVRYNSSWFHQLNKAAAKLYDISACCPDPQLLYLCLQLCISVIACRTKEHLAWWVDFHFGCRDTWYYGSQKLHFRETAAEINDVNASSYCSLLLSIITILIRFCFLHAYLCI